MKHECKRLMSTSYRILGLNKSFRYLFPIHLCKISAYEKVTSGLTKEMNRLEIQ